MARILGLHAVTGLLWFICRLSAGCQVAEESRGLGRVVGILRSSLTDKYPFTSPWGASLLSAGACAKEGWPWNPKREGGCLVYGSGS